MELIDVKHPYRFYDFPLGITHERIWVTPKTPGTCRTLNSNNNTVEERCTPRLAAYGESGGELRGFQWN